MRADQGGSEKKPVIPDHEVLNVIGRGAFGAVWLARSVTGAMRAVKVVRREDFSSGGSFEREFEGIRKFEPKSRQNLSVIDILQVGRNDEEHWYYYVMELADDASGAEEIRAETYVPDTLGRRMREEGMLSLEDCVALGVRMADGLEFLHQQELVHRDVKPGNVVFVEGEARLADVGLVAAAGEKTFVGTEGFVAPEGPGTPLADIFSLGMVLYEASTGKDRLDFPDVPSALGPDVDRELWKRVNRAVCRACSANTERRFQSAAMLGAALRGEKTPEPRTMPVWLPGVLGVMGLLLFGLMGFWFGKDRWFGGGDAEVGNGGEAGGKALVEAGGEGVGGVLGGEGDGVGDVGEFDLEDEGEDGFPVLPEVLEIVSEPVGATVYQGELWLGQTPVYVSPVPDNPVIFHLRMDGYRSEEREFAGAFDDRTEIRVEMEPWKFPQRSMRWTNSLGRPFNPSGDLHRASVPVEAKDFLQFARETEYPYAGDVMRHVTEEGEECFLAAMTQRDARAFAEWLVGKDRAVGLLSDEHFYRIDVVPGIEVVVPEDVKRRKLPGGNVGALQAYVLSVRKTQYGSISVQTTPPGAEVYRDDTLIGATPLDAARVRSGTIELEVRLDGYKTVYLRSELEAGGFEEFSAPLEIGEGVNFERSWDNSLGMYFLPVGDVLVSAWETREKDFAVFREEAEGAVGVEVVEESAGALHPVVGVTRGEAEAFCEWLTERERGLGLISRRHRYRLPTDLEWSAVAGLPMERGKDPASREGLIRGVFPWGFVWPPREGTGNFADVKSADVVGVNGVLAGYQDGYRRTAPVDVVEADARGMYHVAGNVWEWVLDDFGGTKPDLARMGVMRGGGWTSATMEELLASGRRPVAAETRREDLGFRCVLVRE